MPRPARVAELLRKAIEWKALLNPDDAANRPDMPRREGLIRAPVTKVMGMLRLAPEIQQTKTFEELLRDY